MHWIKNNLVGHLRGPAREFHVAVSGATGAGATNLLLAIAAEDLRAGEAVCFLDYAGDAASRAARLVPEERASRAAYLSLEGVSHASAALIRRAIGESGILIADLSRGGEGLLEQVYDAVRDARPATPVHLFIDDLARVTSPRLTEIISGARRLGISLVVAYHYDEALTQDVRSAVASLLGTRIRLPHVGRLCVRTVSHGTALPEFCAQAPLAPEPGPARLEKQVITASGPTHSEIKKKKEISEQLLKEILTP